MRKIVKSTALELASSNEVAISVLPSMSLRIFCSVF
jgi:hypothetical protein